MDPILILTNYPFNTNTDQLFFQGITACGQVNYPNVKQQRKVSESLPHVKCGSTVRPTSCTFLFLAVQREENFFRKELLTGSIVIVPECCNEGKHFQGMEIQNSGVLITH